MRAFLLLVALLATACQKGSPKDGEGSAKDAAPRIKPIPGVDAGAGDVVKPAGRGKDINSKDILARAPRAESVDVKHVLLSWDAKAGIYAQRGGQDPRGASRTNDAAAKLAEEIAAKLKAKPGDIDALIQEYSEDPGSKTGEPYTIKAGSGMMKEFEDLALRLEINEVGIVETDFGYHVMLRVSPPPPDPLESADILARPPNKGPVSVQHILIGWADVPAGKQGRTPDPRALKRTKADADKLAKEVLDKVSAGGDMKALMKEYSEDGGSANDGTAYDVTERARLVEPFKNLSLRLRMNEAGIVKTIFGWHIIKRVEPPPPPPVVPTDALDSADILKRNPVTDKAKVKHVLLGWTEANTGSPPGSTRTRADLEALVKKTMARLKNGEKIDDLAKELSEDSGSAQTGHAYDVTPDAGLVQPFKDLSLRLNVNEFGAVKTQFGIHIIQRVE